MKNFYRIKGKKDNIFIIANFIMLILLLWPSFYIKNIVVKRISITILGVLVLYSIVQVRIYILSKRNNISDMSMDDEKIILYYGSVTRKECLLISDIVKLEVPKWDEKIQVILKNDKFRVINLTGYSSEDIKEIKDKFYSMKREIEGIIIQVKEEDRTQYTIYGKTYIK